MTQTKYIAKYILSVTSEENLYPNTVCVDKSGKRILLIFSRFTIENPLLWQFNSNGDVAVLTYVPNNHNTQYFLVAGQGNLQKYTLKKP